MGDFLANQAQINQNLQINIQQNLQQQNEQEQRRLQLQNEIRTLEQNTHLKDSDIVLAIIGKYDLVAGYPEKYPGIEPHQPTEAELEGMEKSEKKAIVRQYEKEKKVYDRRKAMYEQTAREMNAVKAKDREREEARKKEADRQAMRRFIFGNDAIVLALGKAQSIKDPQVKLDLYKTVLRTMAEELLNSEEFGEALRGAFATTVETTDATDALRMLYSEQATDAEYANSAAMFARIDAMEARYMEQDRENVISRVINFQLPIVLGEEFKNEILLKKAQEGCVDDMDALVRKNQKDYNALDAEVTNMLGISKISGLKGAYIKSKRLEDYETALNQYMKEHPLATEAESKKAVMDAMRKKVKAEADYLSYHESVEGDSLSAEEYKKKGGATYRSIHTASEAARLVEKSNGLLCAVSANKDRSLMELKPSLPKTVKIGERNVEFRRVYKTFLKGMMEHFFDENGKVREEDRDRLLEEAHKIDTEVLGFFKTAEPPEEDTKVILANIMKSQQDADDLLTILGSTENPLFTEIFMESTMTDLIKMEKLSDSNSEESKAMRERLKNTKIKNYADGSVSSPSDADIDKALEECRSDAEKARIALLKVRNMNIKSDDVPILNACSANGNFVQVVNRDLLHKNLEKTEFVLQRDYIEPMQKDAVTRLVNNFNNLFVSQFATENEFEKAIHKGSNAQDVYNKLVDYKNLLESKGKENLDGEVLSEAETAIMKEGKKWLGVCTQLFAKYNYHVGGTVDSSGDDLITTEGFAAETSQFMVEPFTMHAAIGTYHGGDGGKDSFKDYYKHDDPFNLSVVNALKTRIKFTA